MFDAALRELAEGRKTGHWMWFVFPQLAGLGRSDTARFFELADLDEARRYAAHAVLGKRLRQASKAILGWTGHRAAEQVLGVTDARKLRSSMTLFAVACPEEPLFASVLAGFYGGERDPLTLRLLQSTGAPT